MLENGATLKQTLSKNSLDKRPNSTILPYCSENIQDCKVSKYIVVCLSEPFMALCLVLTEINPTELRGY